MIARKQSSFLKWGLWTAALAMAGCASTRHNKAEVDESWIARLPESQLGDVNQLRTQKVSLEDEVRRANVKVDDAQKQLEIAKKDADSVKSQMDADKKALELAQSKGESQGIQQAQSTLNESTARLDTAKARVNWREKGVDVARANKTLADRRVDSLDARIAMAEYQALKKAGDTRADRLSESAFRDRLQTAERAEEDAKTAMSSREQEARQAQLAWQNLEQKSPAMGGSGNPQPER